MISIKIMTHLMTLRIKNLRIWTQPTQFRNLSEISKIDYPENGMKFLIPPESVCLTESVPRFQDRPHKKVMHLSNPGIQPMHTLLKCM